MGDTHLRSNLIEQSSGQKVVYSIGSFNDYVKANDYISAANARATKYFRLGTDCYIINVSTDPGAFNAASIGDAASTDSGIAVGDMGDGTIAIIASKASPASNLWMKVDTSWLNITAGNLV